MIFKNSLNLIIEFFSTLKDKIEIIYFNSNYYDKKISKININDLTYKPSPHLLTSIIQYQKKK